MNVVVRGNDYQQYITLYKKLQVQYNNITVYVSLSSKTKQSSLLAKVPRTETALPRCTAIEALN